MSANNRELSAPLACRTAARLSFNQVLVKCSVLQCHQVSNYLCRSVYFSKPRVRSLLIHSFKSEVVHVDTTEHPRLQLFIMIIVLTVSISYSVWPPSIHLVTAMHLKRGFYCSSSLTMLAFLLLIITTKWVWSLLTCFWFPNNMLYKSRPDTCTILRVLTCCRICEAVLQTSGRAQGVLFLSKLLLLVNS